MMKVSYKWLAEILQVDLSPQEMAEKLTGAGFPVEELTPLAEELDGVVTAEILEVRPHPNADRLSLTRVSDGANVYDVVCGARNIAPGDKVPLAKVGAVLPGNFRIKKAKIRGQESMGMLCSAEELRLDLVQAEDGILQLPADCPPGLPLAEYLGLDDVVMDIELSANRGDLLSVRGLAAEISAALGQPFALPLPEAPAARGGRFPVSIATPACYCYTGRLISGVKVQPSPLWLQLRLLACGLRPVNNIVDATNLVMLEWGQPLHAFDADKLPELEITVRQARAGETMVTLDNKERRLEPGMMLITSGDKPVAIAGVMGSLDSEVNESTRTVLLESAGFDPVSVRVTAKALGLASEAASRYEKGVDPAVIVPASHRAAALISQLAGGEIGELVSAGCHRSETWTVEASLAKINALLGTEIPRAEAERILINLGLEVQGEGDALLVKVDQRRSDLRLWQDIAEEVGRLHGLDNIPAALPRGVQTVGVRKPAQRLEWLVRDILVGCGLCETVPYTFISPEMQERSLAEPGVELANPLTRERSIMRGDMLPSLLETVAYNLAHGQHSIAVFEIGSVYRPVAGQELPEQPLRVAAALCGTAPVHWQRKEEEYDFFHIKGVAEQLLAGLGADASFVRAERRQFHPGRCAAVRCGEELLGYVGQVHPGIAEAWKIDVPVWVMDFDFQALVRAHREGVDFAEPSRYPAVRRDLALETDTDSEAGTFLAIIRQQGGPLLEAVECFDVYTGPNLGPGRRSLAFSLRFRHGQRTLTDEEVQALMDKIIARLEQAGARLRS